MPRHEAGPRFSFAALRAIWRFSIGNLLIGCASCLLAQADKLIVAKFTNLVTLAAYSLCFTLGLLITNLIVAPVESILLPRFSRFVADREDVLFAVEYQVWTQFLAVLVFPIAAVLAGLPGQVVSLWLGRHIDLLPQMYLLLPPIAIGAALSAITFPVYCAQLATGWTKLSIAKNVIALAIVLPTLWLLVPKYGAIVGADCWLGINLGYYLIEVPVMHRYILPHALRQWYLQSTLPALGVTMPLVVLAHLFVPSGLPTIAQFGLVVAMLLVVFASLVVLLPYPRRMTSWFLNNWRRILVMRSLRGFDLLAAMEITVVPGGPT
jgi:O-antigen/teichoic acid export membrane protein